jgi:predicted O-linked N-acetylglucosamine transferase (SPINDLY family)
MPPDIRDLLVQAVTQHQSGALEPAEALYLDVLQRAPQQPDALHLLGVIRYQQSRFTEAVDLIGAALDTGARVRGVLSNYGLALQKLGRIDEALAIHEEALALEPTSAETLNNLGTAQFALRRYETALTSFEGALVLRPGYIDAIFNRATALSKLKRHAEAVKGLDEVLALSPTHAEAHYWRGVSLHALARHAEALRSFERAVELDPNHADAWGNIGEPHLRFDHPEQAVASYRRSLAIRPSVQVHSSLIFALNFMGDMTTAEHQAERRIWADTYTSGIEPMPLHPRLDTTPDRRLRIGYVSSHFRRQAATYAFAGAILHHDPKAFHVTLYSDTAEADDVTALLRKQASVWRETADLTDQALAQRVHDDRIDILVDCVGHMVGHRPLLFALKPAPIQVTAWGEPTGTGLRTIDYLFADPVLVPPEERGLLAERVYDLPNFIGYWTPDEVPRASTLPALANGHITFGSFNRLSKLQQPVLRRWAAILRALPSARLIIKGDQPVLDAEQRARIDAVFEDEQIEASRVSLLGLNSREGHFRAYQQVDIALDPFPHGGGMTTLDALWMGVPVITSPGRTISSRLAAASLTSLDLRDWIAADAGAYVALAAEKAKDLDALARLRAELRSRVAASPFGDARKYARAVEAAYRTMWRDWCAAQASAPR